MCSHPIITSTEQPQTLNKADIILAGIDEKSLLLAVDTAVSMNAAGDHGIPVPNYVDENVSTKVVKIIQSYTGVVNKMVFGGSFRELFKPLTGCLSVPLPSHSIRTHS